MLAPHGNDVVSAPIVVGYDGSEAAQAALDRAIEEAGLSGARLVVVAVSELTLDPEGPMSFGTYDVGPVPTLPLSEPPEIEHVLAAARTRIEAANVQADYVWEAGEPAGAILREARERGAGLVVVGKTHHSRLGRWLGTDVAAEVERAAGCPVLLVEG
jgi:nucleotide-binding universal stress UspA family protein